MWHRMKTWLFLVLTLVPVSAVALRAQIVLANVDTADSAHESRSGSGSPKP